MFSHIAARIGLRFLIGLVVMGIFVLSRVNADLFLPRRAVSTPLPRNSPRHADRVGGALFINDDYAPLVATGLQILMRRLLAQINISGATHIFRHTFANEYVRADGSVEKLRRILGHVSLDTTQLYVHLLPGDLLAHRTDVDPLEAPLFYFKK